MTEERNTRSDVYVTHVLGTDGEAYMNVYVGGQLICQKPLTIAAVAAIVSNMVQLLPAIEEKRRNAEDNRRDDTRRKR